MNATTIFSKFYSTYGHYRGHELFSPFRKMSIKQNWVGIARARDTYYVAADIRRYYISSIPPIWSTFSRIRCRLAHGRFRFITRFVFRAVFKHFFLTIRNITAGPIVRRRRGRRAESRKTLAIWADGENRIGNGVGDEKGADEKRALPKNIEVRVFVPSDRRALVRLRGDRH